MIRSPVARRALLGAAGLAMPRLARAQPPVLRVANQRGGLRSLLEASGLARDLPYRIEWSEFPAAQPLLEALNANAVDAGSMGDLNFFSVAASGAPIRAIGATRQDGASQALVVKDAGPLKTVADLRGKRIAAARGGWTHYSLLCILQHHGIAPAETRIAWLLPAEAGLAFRTGDIDAWSIWEPYTSLEMLNFGARVLADARGLTPSASILAANDTAIRNKRPLLADLVRRQAAGWDWAQANIPAYAAATSALIRLPEPVLQRAYRVSDTRGITLDAPLIEEWQAAVDRAVAFGVIPKPIRVADAVDTSFLPEAAG